jgi:hypothetical protein
MARILAPAILAAAAVAAAPAQAHPPKPHPKPNPDHCKKHHAVGFDARGVLVSQTLTQTAGASTPGVRDDRYSGTITIEVKRANHRAPAGVQTYTLDGDRVRFDTAAPAAGDRVKLHGKLARKGCTGPIDIHRVTFRRAR